jgi:hypothetical protein
VAQTRLDDVREGYREPLRAALGSAGVGNVRFLSPPKSVADDTTKVLAEDAAGRPAAVLLISSDLSPDLVARGQQRARAAREALGPALGAAVLMPLDEGNRDGRSWAILPYRRPLAEGRLAWRWQRRAVGRAVLDWLEAVAAKTRQEPLDSELAGGFVEPLQRALSVPDMPGTVRDAAKAGLAALGSGAWRPHWVLAHNDLWKGNLLRSGGEPSPFVVIDWPASAVRGHAFFDLVRCARSLGLGRSQLALAVRRQATLLGCQPAEARFHVAAAVGHIGLILEHMPPDLYRQMGANAFETLDRVVER